jgi:alcohol dehydrogenase class IV
VTPARQEATGRAAVLATVDYAFDVAAFQPTRIVSCDDEVEFLVSALPSHSSIGIIHRPSWPANKLADALLAGSPMRRVVDLGGISSHTPVRDVRDAAARAPGAGLDFIVAIGGGSVIDGAKLVALSSVIDDVYAHRMEFAPPGSLVLNHLVPERASRVPAVIAVPTTAGSGSEISAGAGMRVGDEKVLFNQPAAIPKIAVYCPSLVCELPLVVRYAAWGSAIARGIEALYARNRSWLSDAWALRGLQLLGRERRRATDSARPSVAEARAQLAGSMLTAKAIGAAGGGLIHAIGHAAGGLTGLAHGLIHAALVRPAVEQVVDEVPELENSLRAGIIAVTATHPDSWPAALDHFDELLHHELEPSWREVLPLESVIDHALHEPLIMTHPVPATRARVEQLIDRLITADQNH